MADCARCSRRSALAGMGALVVLGTIPGCAKTGIPVGVATSCAGGLCLDVTADANAPVRTVGGAVLVRTSRDSIAVVRTSATAVVALSAICTHEGCLTDWDASSQTLDCPCHGSVFGTTGAVLRGPAAVAVRSYGATLSGDGNEITIVGA